MKNIKKYMLAIALGFGLVSCSNYTDGFNENPNSFTSAPGDLIVGQAELEVIKLSASNASRFAGIFTDQFTGEDRQYILVDRYDVTTGDFNDEWDDIYVDGLAQAQQARKSGEEAGNELLVGVSEIMEAILIGETASLWGDVPYSTANDILNNPHPTYDSQQSVLDAAQKLLSDAIGRVGDAEVVSVYGTPFVGNGAKWAEIAHTLKARYYLVAKDYANALAHAQMGINSPDGSLLSSHRADAGARNLYYQFLIDEREGYLGATGSNLHNLLDGTRDRYLDTPGDTLRLPVYFDGNKLNSNPGGYFAIDASFPIVSYIENKLIEAEAAARTGGDALTPFNEVRDHLASVYGGDFPHSSASGDDLIKQILEEKYCSLPGSLQIFHDVRRTKNMIDVPIKGTGFTTIPQRFYYPQIEISTNDNFPGLVDLFEPTPVNK